MLDLIDALYLMSVVDEVPLRIMAENGGQIILAVKSDAEYARLFEGHVFQLQVYTNVLCYPEAAVLVFMILTPTEQGVHVLTEMLLDVEDEDGVAFLDKLREQSEVHVQFYDPSLTHLFTKHVDLDSTTRVEIMQQTLYAFAYNASCRPYDFDAACERMAGGEQPADQYTELAQPKPKTPFTDQAPQHIVDLGWERDVPQEKDWRGRVKSGARLWFRLIDEDRRPTRSSGRIYVAFFYYDYGAIRGRHKKRAFWTSFDVEEGDFRQSSRNPDFWGLIYHLDQPEIPANETVDLEVEFRLPDDRKLFRTTDV